MANNPNIPFALILWLCAILGASKASATFTPVLNTRGLGRLVGVQDYSEDGIPYFSFKGIRFAEPPIGPLRFREPIEASPVPGNTVVNATAFGPSCTQIFRNPATLRGSEDCLRLNVYTPSASPGQYFPVVVYFHGGAFMYGNATASPTRVVSRGIVVVTVQYRVGILGFLSSGDRDLPGNYGLLDQQLALQWVQKNIDEFCGDRNRVTVSGSSAGSAATSLHLVSPGSSGLFRQAISTSGVFLNPWVMHVGEREKVRGVARAVGCRCSARTPISALLPCLRSADAAALAEAQLHFQGWHEDPFAPFGPVVDGTFLPDDPYKLLVEGKVARVPLLLSYTTGDGLYNIAEFMENRTALGELDRHWKEIAPLLLDYLDSARSDRDRDYTSGSARKKYLGHAPINYNTLPQLIQLATDRLFVAGIGQFAKTLASVKGGQRQPLYMYQYAYRGQFSVSQGWAKSNTSQNRGPSHSDDNNFIFPGWHPAPPIQTKADYNMARSLVDIWESFIKTGNPTTSNFPVWPPVPPTGDRITMLRISSFNTGALVTVPELGLIVSSFWRSLPLLETGTGTRTGTASKIGRLKLNPSELNRARPEKYHRYQRFAVPVWLCRPLSRCGWRYFQPQI